MCYINKHTVYRAFIWGWAIALDRVTLDCAIRVVPLSFKFKLYMHDKLRAPIHLGVKIYCARKV